MGDRSNSPSQSWLSFDPCAHRVTPLPVDLVFPNAVRAFDRCHFKFGRLAQKAVYNHVLCLLAWLGQCAGADQAFGWAGILRSRL